MVTKAMSDLQNSLSSTSLLTSCKLKPVASFTAWVPNLWVVISKRVTECFLGKEVVGKSRGSTCMPMRKLTGY